MMSQIQELKPLAMGKGCMLRMFIDHSKPSDSPDYRWSEASYDGKPDSVLLEVPPHWHKYHDEIMMVKEGEIDITIENVTKRYHAGPERIFIPRLARHSIKCVPGVAFVASERSVPAGNFKQWFFADLLAYGKMPSFLYAMRAFWDGDGYPALPGGSRLLDEMFLLFFGGIGKLIMPARKPMEVEHWPSPVESRKTSAMTFCLDQYCPQRPWQITQTGTVMLFDFGGLTSSVSHTKHVKAAQGV